MSDLFMVFDVESIGLHGEGFAVGWCVVRQRGEPGARFVEGGKLSCPPAAAIGTNASREWVAANIPALPQTHATPRELRDEFWRYWMKWKAQGAVLVADCCWPVEAKFLLQCVNDDAAAREWEGPYPLHDLASVLLAMGKDPLGTYERLSPHELPKHDPLADALQSARLLVEALDAAPGRQE